jgi:CubicO group peptidase (beta-lactamase class C family)
MGLDEQLRVWVAERDLSGIVLVTRGGTTEFEGCYGLANRTHGVPVTGRTRFVVASVSKMFTAVTVAGCVRRGQLGFDTPVVDVLPSDRRPETLRPDVTVAHLLTHTSGIADYAEEDEDHPNWVDYASLWLDRPPQRMLRPADYLPIFGHKPPYRGPGEAFKYSNAGYIVLGLLAEELTGLPFPDAVTAAVLEPAGMADSGYFALDEVRPDVATGYIRPDRPDAPWRTNIYSIPIVGSGDGGALCTAADLDRFLRRYDDGTLLGELHDEMLRPRYPTFDERGSIGYGVYLYDDPHARRWGHSGGDDGAAVLIDRLPDLDVNIIVACNVNGVVEDVRNLVLDSVLG